METQLGNHYLSHFWKFSPVLPVIAAHDAGNQNLERAYIHYCNNEHYCDSRHELHSLLMGTTSCLPGAREWNTAADLTGDKKQWTNSSIISLGFEEGLSTCILCHVTQRGQSLSYIQSQPGHCQTHSFLRSEEWSCYLLLIQMTEAFWQFRGR